MKLLADLHTHSKFSRFGHGKSTIEEIAFRANELGLKEVAITDHGFKHFFRTSKKKLAEARKIIDEINTWSQTKVLLGIEADIINEHGDLDIDEETLDMIDILIAGYHRMIKTDFAGYFGHQRNTKKAIQKVTNAYINAINRWPISFITHIDSVLKTDLYEIGCACKEQGIFIEINNRHCNWTSEQLDELIASGCDFVVSSDAHLSDDVGSVEEAFKFIKKHKIPAMSLANVEFEEFELTAKDKEDRFYLNLYKTLNKDSEEVKEAIAASEIIENPTIKVEKTKEIPKLSKEMEDALERLAHEQGIKGYERKDGEESVIEDSSNEENFVSEFDDSKEEILEENQNYQEQDVDLKREEISSDYSEIERKVTENKDRKSYMSHIERTYDAKAPNSSYQEEFLEENTQPDELENITNSLNQFKPVNNRVYRDNTYQNQNIQEQQVEMIKSSYDKPVANNGHGAGFINNENILFDENNDYQKYNVNAETQRKTYSRNETVEINYNVPIKNEKNAQNQVNNQNQNRNYTQSTRNSNGLIDFSSLTDDE